MAEFKIESSFKPRGDQPEAIKNITASLNSGESYTTLLGITGSGKTVIYTKLMEIWKIYIF